MRIPPGGVVIAVVAVVGVPVLIGQAVPQPVSPAQPATTAEAKPAEAALVVNLSGKQKSGSEEALLRIEAAGDPPPKTDLLNADGSHAVPVSSVGAGECDSLTSLKALGKGVDSTWCLRLKNIDDGTQVTGKLPGKGTTLALTVNRRASFWSLPLWTSLLGIAIGVLALLLPLLLQSRIRQGLLEKALDANDERDEDRIDGLRGWVDKQRKLNRSDDELLPLVDWAMREGPAIAAAGETELRERLSHLPAESRYRRGAEKFLESRQELQADDFFSDGKAATSYPTDKWVDGLEKIEAQEDDLRQLEEEVERARRPEDAAKALDEAWRAFRAANRPEAVSTTDAKIDAVRLLLPDRLTTRRAAAVPLVHFAATIGDRRRLVFSARARGTVPQPETLDLPASLQLDRLRLFRVASILLGLATIALALLTIKFTVYEPVPNFGSDADYFKVISAGIAAGVGSTLVGLSAPWNPRKAVGDSS